jgi:hypothetical protein
MVALRTPQWGPGRKPAGNAVWAVSNLLARAVLVVATLMMFTFASVAASQACPSGTSPTAHVRQIAQNAPQVAKRAAVASSVVKLAVCANGAGHCHGLACAGSCCPACSAGMIVAGRSVTRDVASSFYLPPLQTPPPSIESDAQFRPPRIVL